MPTPIAQELLAAQFEKASFPFWLVDDQLTLLEVNLAAREMCPLHCLADGVRLFLSPQATDEVMAAIATGASVVKGSPTGLPSGMSLSFTPWVSPSHSVGALVMVVPDPARVQADDGLRHILGNVGNIVITQGLRRCASDILTSLATASSQLHSAGVDLADSQLQDINRCCYRLMRAAGNVAGAAQLNADLPETFAQVNFWDNCAELLEAVGTLLRGSGRSFDYNLPDSNLYVECNWDKVAAAILNIISNSYLYGGDKVRVAVTGRDTDGRVCLTIADNGSGLPDSVQRRLYQPFCSSDSLERDNAGMGLGLYLMRSTITSAGGTVTLNTTDEGTTIAMSLSTCDPPTGIDTMGSTSADYMQDRYSPVYVALCDVVAPPPL